MPVIRNYGYIKVKGVKHKYYKEGLDYRTESGNRKLQLPPELPMDPVSQALREVNKLATGVRDITAADLQPPAPKPTLMARTGETIRKCGKWLGRYKEWFIWPTVVIAALYGMGSCLAWEHRSHEAEWEAVLKTRSYDLGLVQTDIQTMMSRVPPVMEEIRKNHDSYTISLEALTTRANPDAVEKSRGWNRVDEHGFVAANTKIWGHEYLIEYAAEFPAYYHRASGNLLGKQVVTCRIHKTTALSLAQSCFVQ